MANKPIQIDEELHKKVKEVSKRTGIKIKNLVESAIERYISLIKVEEGE